MSRPAFELADIFRQYGQDYRASHALPLQQLRVMRAIEVCRSAALGGHVEQCGQCDRIRVCYNSCRNRHCPKCQNRERARWLEGRTAELLPVEYFHVVFTLPEQIAAIAFYNPKVVYSILLRSSAETLLTIARDPKHLGAEIGFFSVLHTWGQNLLHHPHAHCVVPGGGLSSDGQQWIGCRRGFFLPVRVLSRLFRRLFLQHLQKAFDNGELQLLSQLEPLQDPASFPRLIAASRQHEWVVYAKPPFGGPQQVLQYLGRYTHRVAISNERLLGMENGEVRFHFKDYRENGKIKTMTLAADEFIRRFLIHTLPPGFPRIRYYGRLSARHRKQTLLHCRKLLVSPLLPNPEQLQALATQMPSYSPRRCPRCQHDSMEVIYLLLPRPFFTRQPLVVDSS